MTDAQDVALASTGREPGMVVRQQANFYYVRAASGEVACSLRGNVKKAGVWPLVGDRVIVEHEPAARDERRGAIIEILPRTRVLDRPAIANVDQVIVVVSAAQPDFDAYVVDKLLVLAAWSDLEPLLVINKRDLASAEDVQRWVGLYSSLGVTTLSTQATGPSVAALLPHLAGRVSVLAGPSGVGKSSIVNGLQPGLRLVTSEVSTKLQRGRHTTRHACLYPLEGAANALLADTPGFSALELSGLGGNGHRAVLAASELGWFFPDIAPYIADCKYPSCLHIHEPHCAVKAHGIQPERYTSYLRMLEELQALEREAADRTNKVEAGMKKRSGRDGVASPMVKVDVADREATRRVRNQQLTAEWQDEVEDEREDAEEDLATPT